MKTNALNQTLSSVLDAGEYVIDFPLAKIRINPQVRRKYKAEKVEEMAASLQEHGQMQPCIISFPDNEGFCDMFVGHTRFMGHEKIGSLTLKAIQRKDPPNKLIIQLAENLHRENLDIVDTALGVAELSKEMKPKDICLKLSVKNAWVSKMQAIGKLPDTILDELNDYIGDVETFYLFAQLHKKNPEVALDLVAKAKEQGALSRSDVKNALNPEGDGQNNGAEGNGQNNDTEGSLQNNGAEGDGQNSGTEGDGQNSGTEGKDKAPSEKKKTQVIVSFEENGSIIEGTLLTTKVTGTDGMMWIMIDGLESQIPAEELKIVRVCYA